MRALIMPKSGQHLTINARLAHQLFPIDSKWPAAPYLRESATPTSSVAMTRVGYEKLAALSDCGSRLSTALDAALPDDETTAVAVPYSLMDECRLTIEVNAPKEPSIEPIDAASVALVVSIDALGDALRNQQAGSGVPTKLRRQLRAVAKEASVNASRRRLAWISAMNESQSRWIHEDTERIRKRDGASMHVLLREVVVASDRWVRAQQSGAKAAAQFHTSFANFYESALADAKAHPAAYKESGGQALLGALSSLATDAEVENAVKVHNKAVGLFNQLSLPLVVNP